MEQHDDITTQESHFLSLLSHELKTPLFSLKAYLELLQRKLDSKEYDDIPRLIEKSQRPLHQMLALIDNIHDVSWIHNGYLDLVVEPWDIHTIITEVLDIVQPTLLDHTIVYEGQEGYLVEVDKRRIAQVLTNLLTNAARYSPEADRIIIEVQADQNVVTVRVQDFGIGISDDDLAHVFACYYRSAQAPSQGLGVGLYITNEIINKHKGSVDVASTIGEGSVFSFSLPLLQSIHE